MHLLRGMALGYIVAIPEELLNRQIHWAHPLPGIKYQGLTDRMVKSRIIKDQLRKLMEWRQAMVLGQVRDINQIQVTKELVKV